MTSTAHTMAFVVNLWTINTFISKKIDGCLGSIHGISFTEYMILFHLSNAYKKTKKRIDLAQDLGLTASGITRLISPMEKIGLVKKNANPRDARVSLVELTAVGQTVLRDSTVSLKETSKHILQGIEGEKLTDALTIFKVISKDQHIQI